MENVFKQKPVSKIAHILEMIKFQHSIFALPFALMSAAIAIKISPGIQMSIILGKVVWIIVAMVGARSSAMAFNRIIDFRIDAMNPRTSNRELPKGTLGISEVWWFTGISAAIFLTAAGMLNGMALGFAPVALLIIWGYSYTKRYTWTSHLFLGLSLAIAPMGAWIAIREEISLIPMIISVAVVLWTAGFDIIYSTQDVEFDTKQNLYSIPVRFGIQKALSISMAMHLAVVFLLVLLKFFTSLSLIYMIGVAVSTLVIIYEHAIVKPNDLSKVNAAFFTANGVVSIVLMIFTLVDLKIWNFFN